ncbi:hypothetical protein BDP27DRAFT_1229184, partial [Rhodocollybia butyracea]
VYSRTAVDFEPSTQSCIPTDSKTDCAAPRTATTVGNYDCNRGGHVILQGLNLVLEFPPGATAILPPAPVRHFHTPEQG